MIRRAGRSQIRANSGQLAKEKGLHRCKPLIFGGRGRNRTADTGIFNPFGMSLRVDF